MQPSGDSSRKRPCTGPTLKLTKVCLVTFLLVAGFHFKKDLTRDEFSWEKKLEREGIQVRVENRSMGEIPGIIEIFATHIKEAPDVIPR